MKGGCRGMSDDVLACYNRRDLILYALGVGCVDERYIYENSSEFGAFPTYPACLEFKGESFDVVDYPPPGMSFQTEIVGALEGTRAVLDAELTIEQRLPMPAGGCSCSIAYQLTSLEKKRSGALVRTASTIRDAAGEILCVLRGAFFALGAQPTAEQLLTPPPVGDALRPRSLPANPVNRSPDASVEEDISDITAQLYRLSGDYNPIHIDPASAQLSGLRGPVLHGRCTLGIAVRHVLTRFGDGDAARFVSCSARFAKPFAPGERLLTRMWRDESGGGRVVFECVVREGEGERVVLTNGMVQLSPTGPAAPHATLPEQPSSRL
jgi:3-hydroxyacyl-CoA dehydrogenase/3a,7a,12a-trihydroxy-5b-cholest-24-enoyl-CoA hydratase